MLARWRQINRLGVWIGALVGVGVTVGGGLMWWYERSPEIPFVAVATPPARLIDGIESYVRVDEFLSSLTRQSISHHVQHPVPSPRNARRPPFVITTVMIPRYANLGHVGVLKVAFFNDRLLGARFFPSAMADYLVLLRSKEGIDLTSRSEQTPSAHTRVYLATEDAQGQYVGWEDIRLAAEMRLWIERYS